MHQFDNAVVIHLGGLVTILRYPVPREHQTGDNLNEFMTSQRPSFLVARKFNAAFAWN